MIVLGVDAGLANLGLAVVDTGGSQYKLLASECVRTSSGVSEPERLLALQDGLLSLIRGQSQVDCVSIEDVFHNRNVSSNAGTNRVIGVVSVVAAGLGIGCVYVRPQEAKAVSGLGAGASKVHVQRMMSRLLGVPLSSHHVSDACAVAIAGYLKVWQRKHVERMGVSQSGGQGVGSKQAPGGGRPVGYLTPPPELTSPSVLEHCNRGD